MPMNARLLRPIASRSLVDADATAYLTAVQTADGEALEPAVRNAITAFVIGCKQDGIWSAIRASCILMGARTLSGALTPLVGAAPTNVNFVSGDYNRRTGLIGNASTKYLNSNRNNNADPQNSKHVSLYASALPATVGETMIGALPTTGAGRTDLENLITSFRFYANSVNTPITRSATPSVGFIGVSRASSTAITTRMNGSTETASSTSQTPYDGNVFCFCRNLNGGPNAYSNARIAFYSIGGSLTLSQLDSRVTTLYTAIGAAIP